MKKIGSKPLGIYTPITFSSKAKTLATEIPEFFKDGYHFEVDFSLCSQYYEGKYIDPLRVDKLSKICEEYDDHIEFSKNEYDHYMHATTKIKNGLKYIILDSDNDNSFEREITYMFPYEEIVPKTVGKEEVYKRDTLFGIDDFSRNEAIVNLNVKSKSGRKTSDYLIEVSPYCLSKLTDKNGNDRFGEHFCLSLIEHYEGYFKIKDTDYTALIQFSLTNLNIPSNIAIVKSSELGFAIKMDQLSRKYGFVTIDGNEYKCKVLYNHEESHYELILTLVQGNSSKNHSNEKLLESEIFETLNSSIKQSIVIQNKDLILFNAWGTWCSACKEQFPEMNTIVEEYGLNNIGIVGEHKIDKEKILKNKEKYGLSNKQYITQSRNLPFISYPQYILYKGNKELIQTSSLNEVRDFLKN